MTLFRIARVTAVILGTYILVLTLYPTKQYRLPVSMWVFGSDAGRGGLAAGTALVVVGAAVGMRWLPLAGIVIASLSARPGKNWTEQWPVWIPFAVLGLTVLLLTVTWSHVERRLDASQRFLMFSALALGGGIGVGLAASATSDDRHIGLVALLFLVGVYLGVGLIVAFFGVFARGVERGLGGEALLQAGCATPFLWPIWPVFIAGLRNQASRQAAISPLHEGMLVAASVDSGLIGADLMGARAALSQVLQDGERILYVAVPRLGPHVWLTDQRLIFVGGRRVTAMRGLPATVGASLRTTGTRERSYWLHLRYRDGQFDNLLFGRDSSSALNGVAENAEAIRQVERAAGMINHAIAQCGVSGETRTPLAPPVPPAAKVPSPQAPAGWYADPWRRAERRYWTGSAWSAHVSTNDVPGTDTPGP